MHGWYWNTGWGWGMMIGMALFWILVIVAVVVAIRYLAGGGGGILAGLRGSESPEFIVKQRYARGEIDREQYERLLAELRR